MCYYPLLGKTLSKLAKIDIDTKCMKIFTFQFSFVQPTAKLLGKHFFVTPTQIITVPHLFALIKDF